MKRLMLAAALVAATATARFALADQLFWVIGNRATSRCEIVTTNPVVAGDVWFADGPYKSRADAKLARSTIGACPKTADSEDDNSADE